MTHTIEIPVALDVRPRLVTALTLFAAACAVAAGLGLLLASDGALAKGDVLGELLLPAVTFTAVGAAIARRVPGNAFGWMLLGGGTVAALASACAAASATGVAGWLGYWLWWPPYGMLPAALLLFPTGRLPSRRWRVPFWLAVAVASLGALALAGARAIDTDPFELNGLPTQGGAEAWMAVFRLSIVFTGAMLLVALASLVVRLRGADELERRQVLCLAAGGIALFIGILLAIFDVPGAWLVGVVALPVAAGVAIVWHRLYDLDLVVNRSLVYLTLSATLLAAYGATVVLARDILGGDSTTAPALLAAALVALGLNPLRRRLQRSVDKLLYGQRNDPYAVMSDVIDVAGRADSMLTDVAEAVARNLALPYVAIQLDAEPDLCCEWGRKAGTPIATPLSYGGEPIGSLLVSPRTIGGRLTAAEHRLLEDLSFQVALTARAVELSRGLQRSREALIAAREEERRRLRSDLHDDLGPTLAAMTMELDAARNLLTHDTAAVDELLKDLREQARGAVGNVRRVVYGLRPPTLDELGLVGAIREAAERFSTPDALAVTVIAPDALPPLPAAVEVAALRIVQEAVANVARHSGARVCTVALEVDGAVEIDVSDDGSGLLAGYRPGVGLRSMRERAAEVGGSCSIDSFEGSGTRVRARLPFAHA